MTDAQKLGNFMRIMSMDPVSGNMVELSHEFKATKKIQKSKKPTIERMAARCTNCGMEAKYSFYCSIKCESEITGVQTS
jgi:hypothetical protein